MQTNGPWKIKESHEKYKNSWIRVREDQVIHPNGENGIFGIVEILPWVSVLPMDEDGFVYLAKEFDYSIGKEGVQLASGGIDANESSLNAAKRELKEELGIEANEWVDLWTIEWFATVIQLSVTMYFARGLTFLQANPEGTEKIEMVRMLFEEALKTITKRNEVFDVTSYILISKVAEYLKNEK